MTHSPYYATIRVEATHEEGEVWYRASLFNFTGRWWRQPQLAVQSLISGMPSDELVKLLTKLGVEITAVVTPEISKICVECGLPMVEGTTACPICGH